MTPRQLTLAYAACQILSACLDIGALIASATTAFGGGDASTTNVCKPGSGNVELCRFPVWSLSVAIVGHLGMLAYSAAVVLGPVTSTQTTAGVLIGGGCLAAELAPAIIISSSLETAGNSGWRAAMALMYTASVVSLAQLLLIATSRKLFKKSKPNNLTVEKVPKLQIKTVDSLVSGAELSDDQGGFGFSKLRRSISGLMPFGRKKLDKQTPEHNSDQYPRPQHQEDDASPYAVSNMFGLRDQQMQPISMQPPGQPHQQYTSYDDNNYQQPYYGTVSTSKEAAASNKGFAASDEEIDRSKTQGAWPYSTTEI